MFDSGQPKKDKVRFLALSAGVLSVLSGQKLLPLRSQRKAAEVAEYRLLASLDNPALVTKGPVTASRHLLMPLPQT